MGILFDPDSLRPGQRLLGCFTLLAWFLFRATMVAEDVGIVSFFFEFVCRQKAADLSLTWVSLE